MTNLSAFHFHFPLQLRWHDLDALGHVNNAVFVTYFEVARGHYMPTACPGWDWHKHMFLIAHVEVHFRKELLLLAQKPTVHIRTAHIGTKSFVLEYVISSIKEGETVIHCEGKTTQVMFDMQTRKTKPIDDWVQQSLQAYEAGNA
jgi:acyl-CoA thioester hydrolase